MMQSGTTIYKIMTTDDWRRAAAAGIYGGSAVDRADGFIHFSAAAQVRETAARHFADQDDLVLVAFEASVFGNALRWEPSRGGALFPHLYATLDPALALWVKPLPWAQGAHQFPEV